MAIKALQTLNKRSLTIIMVTGGVQHPQDCPLRQGRVPRLHLLPQRQNLKVIFGSSLMNQSPDEAYKGLI